MEKYIDVNNILNKILLELNNEKYQIDASTIERLQRKQNRINIINSRDKEVIDNFYTEQGEYYRKCTFKNYLRSFFVELPPILDNSTLHEIIPIINLMNYENKTEFKFSAYHEMCHFLSSGLWNITNITDSRTVIEHVSGICAYKYIYENGEVFVQRMNYMSRTNEFLNDWVATKLFKQIEHIEFEPQKKDFNSYLENRIKSENKTPDEIIGYYFSNNMIRLKNILISNELNTLEKVEKSFNSKKVEIKDEER